jgi:hypothetical protein
MVGTTLYISDNDKWKEKKDGKGKVGGNVHAEVSAYEAFSKSNKSKSPTCILFVQDAAPCEKCHEYFLKKTTEAKQSFIFIIDKGDVSGVGYPIQKDVKVTPLYWSEENDRTEKAKASVAVPYALTGPRNLDKSELPALLFYHNGTAFLHIRPVTFPAVPSLTGVGIDANDPTHSFTTA